MSFSDTAKQILERGFDAFRNMHVRPEGGHTAIQKRMPGEGFAQLKWGCVVGAIAYEAATLQRLSDDKAMREARDDDNAKEWAARLFQVSTKEMSYIEQGFDAFFEVTHHSCEDEECDCEEYDREEAIASFEKHSLDQMNEMYQVGWHVAKRATKHYMELDAAEDEAWKVYDEKNLKHYKPLKLWSLPPRDELGRFMSEKQIDEAIANVRARIEEECEGEDCPDPADNLLPVA